jgi:hypothetical protein
MCQTQAQQLGQIELAIRETLPPGPGRRNRCLFNLARQIKAIMPDAAANNLRSIVQEWYRRALPYIRTKDFSVSWADFVTAWQAVKVPKGATWTGIVEAARTKPLPREYDGPAASLVNLCIALQEHHGPGQAWPLSCRKAGGAIRVSHQTAAKLLKMLRFDSVLELVTEAGPKGSRRAAEYRMKPAPL